MHSVQTSRTVLPGVSVHRRTAGELRIALYSHDALGIGHLRRNLLLAETLAALPERPSVLLLSGAAELDAFPLPAGVDCLTVPSFRKRGNGDYRPGRLRLSSSALRELRSHTLLAALRSYRPHVLIVDKVALGVCGELQPALESLRRSGRTRLVLGLRDVLDDPAAARREWVESGADWAVRRFYHAVWVYGDPAIYDLVAECRLGRAVAERVRYAGYLDPSRRIVREAREEGLPEVPEGDAVVLCQMGGGQDGATLAERFARTSLPPRMRGWIVTGPFLPERVQRRLTELAARRDDLLVTGFSCRPGAWLGRSDRVISMGGYNSMCEIVASRTPALIVPRVTPRSEQWIRARRFADLGLVEVMHPDEASPEAMTGWLSREAPGPRPEAMPDFGGLRRIPLLLREALGDGDRGSQGAHARPAPAVASWPRLLLSLDGPDSNPKMDQRHVP